MTEPGVGHKLPPRKVSWLQRDALLFNLSIGCEADESQFVYVRYLERQQLTLTRVAKRIAM